LPLLVVKLDNHSFLKSCGFHNRVNLTARHSMCRASVLGKCAGQVCWASVLGKYAGQIGTQRRLTQEALMPHLSTLVCPAIKRPR
jgi:hypothetical protein